MKYLGCFLFFVLITHIAFAQPDVSRTVCSGVNVTITATDVSLTAGTTFTWTRTAFIPDPAAIANSTDESAGAASFSQTLTNTTIRVATVEYSVTPTTGNVFKVTINVNPVPNITNQQSPTICSGTSFYISPAGVPLGTQYTWTVSSSSTNISGQTSQLQPQSAISQKLTNSSTTQNGQVIYNVTPTNPTSPSCPGTPFTVTVPVNRQTPAPTLTSASLSPTPKCSGVPFTYTVTAATTGTTISWSRAAIKGINNPSASGGPATNSITINETLNDTTTQTVVVNYVFILTLNGCSNTQIVPVTINPAAASIKSSNIEICSSNLFDATPPPNSVPLNTNYTWSILSISPQNSIAGALPQNSPISEIKQTLVNRTISPAIAIYRVTPISGSCSGIPFNVSVTVNPAPNITSQQNTSTCSDIAFNLSPTNVPSGTTYTWADPTINPSLAITGGSAQTTPQTAINQVLTNTTINSATATYSVTPTAGNCIGPNFNVVVTVNPVPKISPTSQSKTVCSGIAFLAPQSSVPTNTLYSWGMPQISPANSLDGASGATNVSTITQTLINKTNAPATAVYTISPISGNCTGESFTLTVTVNPSPNIANQSFTTCSANPFDFLPPNAPPGTTYTWTAPAMSADVSGGTAQNIAQNSIVQTLNYIGNGTGTATYKVTPSVFGCSGATFDVVVTINPSPVVSNIANSTSCSGVSFTITPNSNLNATTYTWGVPVINPTGSIKGETSQTIPQSNITETLTNNTTGLATATYTITPFAAGCAGKAFTLTHTVNPTPNVASLKTSVCSGNTFIVSPPNTPVGTTYTWTNPVQSPPNSLMGASEQVTPLSAITQNLTNISNTPATASYTVTPATGNCVGASFTVEVLVNLTANLADMSTTICSGATFDVKPTGVPTGTTYTWSTPQQSNNVSGGSSQNAEQSSISQTLTNTGSVNGTVVYTVTPNSSGCLGKSFSLTVTVKPLPVVLDLKQSDCSGTTFTATPSSNLVGTTHTWALPVINPVGSITGETFQTTPQSNITQTLYNNTSGVATATYTITPFAAGCAGKTFTLTQTVNPTPNVAALKTSVCSGNTFIVSPPNTPVGTTYTWTNPAQSPLNSLMGASEQVTPLSAITQNLTNIINTPATASYMVTPATGNCIGTPFTVEVLVNLSANLADMSTTICSGATFDVKPTGVPTGTTYTWSTPQQSNNVSGGSSQNVEQSGISQTLTNTGSVNGTVVYTVTPNSSGCLGKSFSLTVTVKPLPIVLDLKQSDCSGTTFTATPSSNLVGTTYTWALPVINPVGSITGALARSSGVPAISQTLTNSTNNIATATYSVVPTANGCTGNTFAFEETVIPIPTITTQTTTACSGTAFNVSPSDVPIGTTTLYTWSAPVINPANSLTGGSAQTNPLTVISQTLTNTTKDPATATYNVTPVSGSCVGRSFSVVVTVTPKPELVDQTTSICSGSAFSITPPNAPQGTMYTWEAPVASNGVTGGSAQTTPQPSISQTLNNINTNSSTGTAVYTVTPAVGSCKGNTFTVTVYINSNSAVLSSSLTPPPVCSGAPFIYEPTSITPNTAFLWTRDSTIGISNPPKTGFGTITESLINTTAFPVTVSYKLSLSTNGCINNNTQIVKVVVNPSPTLSSSINPPAICSGSSFNYAATSNTFNVVFNWERSFVTGISNPVATGQGNISEVLNNPTPNAVIVPYIFTLTANGCTNKQTIYVIVNAVLTVQDINIATCSGSTFSVTAPNVPAGTQYLWDMPTQSGGINGGSSQTLVLQPALSQTLINIGTQPGTATYSVTPYTPATFTAACSGIPFKVNVSVNPIPTLSSTKTPPAVCSGTEFNYVPASATPGTIFSWTRDITAGISNQSSSGNAVIKETLLDTTISPIDVTYKFRLNANGCSDTTQKVVVRINPSPVIPDQLLTICSGSEFVLRPDLVPLRTTYTWDAPAIRPGGTLTGFTSQTTPQQTVTDSLTNLTTNMASATYTIQPLGSSCKFTPFNLIVNVKPKSTIGSQSVTTCSGSDFNFVPAKVPVGTTYTWQSPVYSPAFSIRGGSAQPVDQKIINQNLINLTTSVASATYNVTPNSNGCIGDVFSLKVSLNSIPTVKITGDASLCRNLSDTITLMFNGTSPWNYTYVDSRNLSPVSVTGITGPSAQFIPSSFLLSDTTYTFTIKKITDGFCLNDTSTASITQQIKPLPYDTIIAPNGTQLCIGKTIPLVLTPAQSFYQWYFNDTLIIGANDINYDASVAGTYSAKITNSYGCTNNSVNKVNLTQVKGLDIKFSYDSQCKDVEMRFKNLTNTLFTGGVKWLWLFGDGDSSQATSPVHTYKTEGTKNIKIKATVAACNDVFEKDSVILIRRAEAGVELPSVTTYININTQLQARSIQGNTFKYNWTPPFGLNNNKIPDPVFNFNQSQAYLINMTNDAGCITTDKLIVRVFDTGIINIFVPKSFSPNRDGVNDILYPYIAGIKEFHYFKVYNKYGQLLYETRNVDAGWDGDVNGTKQPIGAYVWVAEGINNDGKLVNKMGNVLLLR